MMAQLFSFFPSTFPSSPLLLHFLSLKRDLCLVRRCVELLDDFSLTDELLSDPGDDVQLPEMEVLVVEEDSERCFTLSKFLLELFELVVEFCPESMPANLPLAASAPTSNTSRTVVELYAHVSTYVMAPIWRHASSACEDEQTKISQITVKDSY